ncbi:hypothetical protein Poli38472_008621 [Pythium oligandrum]|uniref:Uncharacterized protein n=1 Tax=Pythium oligandrum TaxID=41045 RepID=A0A8K1C430_PYTOL|nr:hypothetical protein Poli38472_008621 [Pythium oligandrum]|eukprot:TMW55973.1 hypothetical protein Poli38472_008621 [Pythium oligandrum]
MPSVQAVSTGLAARVDAVPAQDGAFATIFYDYGEDSDAMLLAIRVLMRSIRDSQTKYRKLVIVPQDGLLPTSKQRFQQDDPSIEIVRADIPNIFRRNSVMDPRAQLLHMRNKLVLWDDPVLAKLQRIVYLDPENLVLNNFDEIFACAQFCAVDNGQSIVYSNSLLVVSPESIAARNLYSDAIDSFMISGREYNYIGITQGFLPGLFQALEESPLFNVDQDEADDEFEKEAAKSVVRRLPFYYSINHMVFYERMNWDLYKCKDKNKSSKQIPGPLLSYKYSGATIKPWFWMPYVYFEVNWHWLDMRERLQEDHVGFFFSKLISQSVLFVLSWFAYVAICLKLRSEPNGRMRRLSSWNLPGPTTTPALSMDLLNSNVVRKACQFSCNVLYAISSTPIFSSFVLVLVILWTSIYAMPPLMHPRFAAMLWACLLDSLVMTVLVVYHVAHMLRTTEWKREEAPSTLGLLFEAVFEGSKRLPLLLLVQVLFLRYVGNTELFANPVLRPTVLILLLATLCMIQVRFFAQEMRRLARK